MLDIFFFSPALVDLCYMTHSLHQEARYSTVIEAIFASVTVWDTTLVVHLDYGYTRISERLLLRGARLDRTRASQGSRAVFRRV